MALACAAKAAPPPASAFGRVPAVVDAEISPNGQRVAILGGTSEQRIITIATIDQPGLPTLQLGDVETTDLVWAGDEHVVATVAFWGEVGAAAQLPDRAPYRGQHQGRGGVPVPDPQGIVEIPPMSQPILQVTRQPSPRIMVMDLVQNGVATMSAVWSVHRKDWPERACGPRRRLHVRLGPRQLRRSPRPAGLWPHRDLRPGQGRARMATAGVPEQGAARVLRLFGA